MKKCDEKATKCPWAGTGYCTYHTSLEDFDPCPQQLHGWADLNNEFDFKREVEKTHGNV